MTATAVDTMTVTADTKADAIDKARWRWEPYFRVLRVIDVVPSPDSATVWRVTAELELVRP